MAFQHENPNSPFIDGEVMSAFHWKDGWMFERGEAGYVHIWKLENEQPTDIEIAIPPGVWLSILKHVNPRADAEPTTPAGAQALASERRPNSGFDSRDGGHSTVSSHHHSAQGE
jgi:hypothetical protein